MLRPPRTVSVPWVREAVCRAPGDPLHGQGAGSLVRGKLVCTAQRFLPPLSRVVYFCCSETKGPKVGWIHTVTLSSAAAVASRGRGRGWAWFWSRVFGGCRQSSKLPRAPFPARRGGAPVGGGLCPTPRGPVPGAAGAPPDTAAGVHHNRRPWRGAVGVLLSLCLSRGSAGLSFLEQPVVTQAGPLHAGRGLTARGVRGEGPLGTIWRLTSRHVRTHTVRGTHHNGLSPCSALLVTAVFSEVPFALCNVSCHSLCSWRTPRLPCHFGCDTGVPLGSLGVTHTAALEGNLWSYLLWRELRTCFVSCPLTCSVCFQVPLCVCPEGCVAQDA